MTGVPGAETATARKEVTYGFFLPYPFLSLYRCVTHTQHDGSSLARPSVGSLPISYPLGNARIGKEEDLSAGAHGARARLGYSTSQPIGPIAGP